MPAEPQPSPSVKHRLLEGGALLALAAFALWLLLGELGAASFHDGDEALYAAVAREMAESGDLLTPTYWGEPLLNKPPLVYWMMAGSLSWLPGNFELLARLPSALAALVLVALVYGTARRLAGPLAAVGAALLLLGNHQLVFEHGARTASLDSVLVTTVFAALVLGLRADVKPWRLWASGLCTALVMMIKLPLVVFLVPTLAVHLWRADRGAARRWGLGFLAGFLVVVLPWHAYAWITHGQSFWKIYFELEILGRTGKAALDPNASWASGLFACWRSFMPWGPLLGVAWSSALLGWPRGEESRDLRLLAVFAGFVLALFCFVESKWPWYGMPAYPALAVVGAVFLRRLAGSPAGLAAPLLVALPLALRFVAIEVSEVYAPAVRQAQLWPAVDPLYLWSWAGGDALRWSGAALVVVLALVVLARPLRRRAVPLAMTLAAGGLAWTAITVARVPRAFTSPTHALVDELAERGVEHLSTLGFWTSGAYRGRQVSLTSVYFLSIPGADVIDCRGDFACPFEESGGRAALIVNSASLQPEGRRRLRRRLESAATPPEIWILDPAPQGRFARFGVD